MRRVCKNPKCAETFGARRARILCPSCRYLARWMFATGAGAVGVVYGLIQLVGALR